MFEALFGSELPLALRFFIAFLFVLGLIGGAAYLVRRFGAGALASATGRGRQPRLAVIESAPVDGRRRLVIIRRDNVEHLVMIGGASDLVVETNIVRAAPATSAREPSPLRAVPEPMRAPEPIRAAPEPMRAAPEPMRAMPEPMRAVPEPMREPMRAAPEPMRAVPEPMMRPAAASETAMWPLQPEPLGRPQWQPMDEAAWPAVVAPVPEPTARNGDRPAAGFVPDPSRGGPGEYTSRPSPDFTPIRSDVAAGRPANEVRRPAPAATPMAPPPPPAPTPSDEQNLAEMAHRLEAALRRPPAAAPPSGDAAMAKPVSEPMARPAPPDHAAAAGRHAAADFSRPLPEPKHALADPKVQDLKFPDQKPAGLKPQGSKSVYDSLEQEMASLLGRPSGKP
jgi:hypothetical protein